MNSLTTAAARALATGMLMLPRHAALALKDNLRLFTPKVLERINQEVVDAGHALVKKGSQKGLVVRYDSFAVKTHAHFPTDTNLLWNAIRKTIEIRAGLCRPWVNRMAPKP